MARRALTLSTKNLRGLAARFRAADRQLQGAVKRAVKRNGEQLLDAAWHASPVDTGYMRDHLRLDLADGGLTYEVGWRESDFTDEGLAFYPVYVIFGTVKMPARDFFFPLRDAQDAKFRAEVRRAIQNSIRRMNARGLGRAA